LCNLYRRNKEHKHGERKITSGLARKPQNTPGDAFSALGSLFEVSTLLKLRGFGKRAIAILALKGQGLKNFLKGQRTKIV
jgi:hypothetical protein